MRKLTSLISALFAIAIIFSACEKEGGNETKISSHGSTDSHQSSENCMNCHESRGSAEGWFTAAGTVYDSLQNTTYKNTTMRLYSGPNGSGSMLHIVETDAYGNFYTTEDIDFEDGLYTSVQGNIDEIFMASKVENGQCNSCHGNSTDKIWTK